MNKENLQKQIEEMKTKLADMEAELNKPEVIINYWQPKENERFFYINSSGRTQECIYCIDTVHKEDNVDTRYRVFKTKKEAEKYVEYVKAEETLRRVIAEGNAGWLPDWTNNDEHNYVVVLYMDDLKVFTYESTKYLPNFMYIKSIELAEKLMKEYEAEFITYLSY